MSVSGFDVWKRQVAGHPNSNPNPINQARSLCLFLLLAHSLALNGLRGTLTESHSPARENSTGRARLLDPVFSRSDRCGVRWVADEGLPK